MQHLASNNLNQQNALLIAACKKGYVDPVKALIEAGAQVNLTDKSGNSALLSAVCWGHTALVQLLIINGADVKKANRYGKTPLAQAVYGGYIKIVQALINAGADIDQIDLKGKTAVFVAVSEKKVEIIKELINAKADINKTDYEGYTALLKAAYLGYTKIMKILIDAGADINKTDYEGCTAVLRAAYEGDTEIVKALIAAGADINKPNNKGETAFSIAVQQSKNKKHLKILECFHTHRIQSFRKALDNTQISALQDPKIILQDSTLDKVLWLRPSYLIKAVHFIALNQQCERQLPTELVYHFILVMLFHNYLHDPQCYRAGLSLTMPTIQPAEPALSINEIEQFVEVLLQYVAQTKQDSQAQTVQQRLTHLFFTFTSSQAQTQSSSAAAEQGENACLRLGR